MNLIMIKDELEAFLRKSATPRTRLIVGVLFLLVIAALCWREYHQLAPARKAARNAKSSDQFGAALQRAGIGTQAVPSQ